MSKTEEKEIRYIVMINEHIQGGFKDRDKAYKRAFSRGRWAFNKNRDSVPSIFDLDSDEEDMDLIIEAIDDSIVRVEEVTIE